jgi:hypothetical protein
MPPLPGGSPSEAALVPPLSGGERASTTVQTAIAPAPATASASQLSDMLPEHGNPEHHGDRRVGQGQRRLRSDEAACLQALLQREEESRS